MKPSFLNTKEDCNMEATINEKNNAIFSFLQETKDGLYSEIDKNVVETPRIVFSRGEFVFEEEMPVLFSITNQI